MTISTSPSSTRESTDEICAGLPLATRNDDLRKAAKKSGVYLLG